MGDRDQSRPADLRAFAAAHGLTYAESGDLPASTLALSGKTSLSTHGIAGGDLPGGITGVITDRSYTVSQGQHRPAIERHVLVLVTRVPESVGFIPQLYCQDVEQGGLARLLVTKLYETTELESLNFNARYRIGYQRGQDENWVRQLFEPTFVDWLADHAPAGCFFELSGGVLVVSADEDPGAPGAVDRLCGFAATVAERLRSEALEQEGGPPAPVVPPSPAIAKYRERLDDEVAQVQFDAPPPDVRSAAKRYRPFARRRPLAWIASLIIALAIAAPTAGVLLIFLDFFEVPWGTASVVGVVTVALLAVFLWTTFVRFYIGFKSTGWALEALMRGYASLHGLESLDPQSFHAEHMRLRLPAQAQRVLAGRLPALGRPGALLTWEQATRRDRPACICGVVVSMGAGEAVPLLSITPHGTDEGSLVIGGFVVADATGVVKSEAQEQAERARSSRLATLDSRLRERCDIVIDPGHDSKHLAALLSPVFVEWLLSADNGGPLSLSLEGEDLIVLTAATELPEVSIAGLDALCANAEQIRTHFRAAVA